MSDHTVNATKPIPPLTVKDVSRFWSKVDQRGDAECWEWTGTKTSAGYGNFRWGPLASGTTFLAHRLALHLSGVELVPRMVVDHLCFNRACVNPAHLEQVTSAVNNQRLWDRKRSRDI